MAALNFGFARSATIGLVAATVIGLAVNQLLHAFLGQSDEEELDGFPRSRWILSAAIQALVFPLLGWLSVIGASGAGIACSRWLTASALELPGKSLWYVFSLFGSQSRDMCPMPAATSFLMKVHHWVVTIACVLSLFAPKGFGLFIAGTFVLELGSLFYNMRVLYPGNKVIKVMYQTFMPLSNLAALAGGVLLLSMKEVPLWMRVLYFTADVGVCIGRQRHAFKDAGLLGKKAAASQPDPAAQDGVTMKSVGTKRRGFQRSRSALVAASLFMPLPLLQMSQRTSRMPQTPLAVRSGHLGQPTLGSFKARTFPGLQLRPRGLRLGH